MPFVLNIIVELKPEVRQEWLDQWAQLAQYVFDNEPTLISYELLEVENKSNTFMVYERSVIKPDLACSCTRCGRQCDQCPVVQVLPEVRSKEYTSAISTIQ